VAKKRILMMADELSQMGVEVSAELSRLGFDVDIVPDADAAWRALAGKEHEATVVEIVDDLAEGCLITRMLRDRWRVPIIVIAHDATSQDRVNFFRAGADVCMRVPVDMSELIARIGGLFRRMEMNARLRGGAGPRPSELGQAYLSSR
jgi:DNA-binding response OmpR family regulator